jgi:hypothetical protein
MTSDYSARAFVKAQRGQLRPVAIAPEEIIGNWARQEASQMDQYYRQHRIRTGACLNPEMKEWTPLAMVFWTEGTAFKRRDILFKVTFATEQEAELHALEHAIHWIDAGKPPLLTG